MVDADGDMAIVGELGTGARAILCIVDLAIMFAVSRWGHVVLGQLLIVEADVCGGSGLFRRGALWRLRYHNGSEQWCEKCLIIQKMALF